MLGHKVFHIWDTWFTMLNLTEVKLRIAASLFFALRCIDIMM
jgi:hypothetical protein